jgi:hypothetical protein
LIDVGAVQSSAKIFQTSTIRGVRWVGWNADGGALATTNADQTDSG